MKALCIIFITAALAASCSREKKSPPESAPQKKATLNTAPKPKTNKSTTPTNAFQWLVEGDYRLLEGTITTGGGSRESIYAGETIVAYLKVGGLTSGEPITALIKVAGPEGVVFEKNTTLLKGAQVQRPTAVVAVSTGTLSSWKGGDYTLNLELTQKGASKKGLFYIPFQLKGLAPSKAERFTVIRTHLPLFPVPGEPMEVWALLQDVAFAKGGKGVAGEVDVSYQYREAKAKGKLLAEPAGRLSFMKWTDRGPREYLWGKAMIPTPTAPGNYLLRLEFVDKTNGKKVITGENVTIRKKGPGIFSIAGLDPNGVPREVWHRSDQGSLTLTIQGVTAEKAVLDLAVLGPRGGAYLIQKDNPISLKNGKGQFRLPFTVPEFVPAGNFKILFRMRGGTRELEQVFPLKVQGPKLGLSNQMKVYGLELTQGIPAFLSKKTATLRSGRKTKYSFVVSGFTHGKVKKHFDKVNKDVELLRIGLECHLSLTKPLGEDPVQKEKIVTLDRPAYNGINMIRLNGEFLLKDLPRGRYIIRIDCSDKNSSAATQLMRQITLTN